MNSRAVVYSPTGKPLGELDLPVFRTWAMNTYGEAEFSIPANHPKATEEMLNFGNILHVTHATLPDWTGFIEVPRKWKDKTIVVKAVGAEFITDWRYVPLVKVEYKPLHKYLTEILYWVNRYYSDGIPINIGDTFISRASFTMTPGVRLRTVMERIAQRTGAEWSISGVVGPDRNISLNMNIYDQRGVPTYQLLDNSNTEMGPDDIVENGPIYNHVTVYSQADSGGARNYAVSYDPDSISKYGLRATAEEQKGGGSDSEGLQFAADYLLYLFKQPKITIAPTVLNVAETFSNIRLGNVVRWQSSQAGFGVSGLGTRRDARILGMEYDDMTDKLDIVADVDYLEMNHKQFLVEWRANYGRRI